MADVNTFEAADHRVVNIPYRVDHEAEESLVFDDDSDFHARYEHVEHLLGALGRGEATAEAASNCAEPPNLALPSQKGLGDLLAVGGPRGRSA